MENEWFVKVEQIPDLVRIQEPSLTCQDGLEPRQARIARIQQFITIDTFKIVLICGGSSIRGTHDREHENWGITFDTAQA